MSNDAFSLFYEDFRHMLSIKYVLTHRLNQDVLEHFFDAIRAKGGLQDHHDSLQ